MAEPFGVLSGAVGLLGDVEQLIRRLVLRVKSYKAQPASLATAQQRTRDVHNKLTDIKDRLRSDARARDPKVQASLEQINSSIVENMTTASKAMNDLDAYMQERWYRRFLRVEKIAEFFDTVETVADRALNSIDQLTVQLNIISEIKSNERPEARPLTFVPAFIRPLEPLFAVLDFSIDEPRSSSSAAQPSPLSMEATLKKAVLATLPQAAEALSAVTGVSGAGGIGKTVALTGLAYDSQVVSTFTDGVYMLQLGKDATDETVKQKLAGIVRFTGGGDKADGVENADSLNDAAFKTGQWFHGRTTLFLIDDLWASDTVVDGYVGVFRRLLQACGEGNSRMVITTRDREIALRASHEPISFQPRSVFGKQSEEIFLRRANKAVSFLQCQPLIVEKYRGSLNILLKLCAGVPLTLSAVGSGLSETRKGSDSWASALSMYEGKLKTAQRHFTESTEDYPECLEQVIRANLGMAENFDAKLPDSSRRQQGGLSVSSLFARLCVIEKQTLVSNEVLQHLWTELDVDAVLALKRRLLSLQLIICEERGEMTMIRAHDHMLEFCEWEVNRLNDFKKVHRSFLHSYFPEPQKGENPPALSGLESEDKTRIHILLERNTRPWWDLPNTNSRDVLIRSLTRLLRRAGRDLELVGIVTCAHWTMARLQTGGIPALLEDFATCVSMLKTDHPGRGVAWVPSLLAIRNAISDMAQFLLADIAILPSEAHARMFGLRGSHCLVDRYLSTASAGKEWLRTEDKYYREPKGPAHIEVEAEMRASDLCVDWAKMTAYVAKKYVFGEVNLSTREFLGVQPLPERIFAMTGDPNHLLLFTLGPNQCVEEVILWDRVQKVEKRRISHASSTLLCNRDGSVLAILGCETSQTNIVGINVCTGRVLFEHDVSYLKTAYSFALSDDGYLLVMGTVQGSLRFIDLQLGKQVVEYLNAHSAHITDVLLAQQNGLLVTKGSANAVRIWKLAADRSGLVLMHDLHIGVQPMNIMLSQDGSSLLVRENFEQGFDQLKLLDTASGKERFRSDPYLGLRDIALSPNGQSMATVDSDGLVECVDTTASHESSLGAEEHHSSVLSVAFSPNGEVLSSISADDNDEEKVVVQCGKRSWEIGVDALARNNTSLSVSGQWAAVFSSSHGTSSECTILNVTQSEVAYRITYSTCPTGEYALSSCGKRVVLYYHGSVLKILDWTGSSEYRERQFLFDNSGIYTSPCLSMSEDGTRILVSCGNVLRLYEDDKERMTWKRELPEVVQCVAVSPNGDLFAASIHPGTLVVGRTETGYTVAEFAHAHNGSYIDMAISRDNRRIASVGMGDNKLNVWRLSEDGGSSGCHSTTSSVTISRTCSITLPWGPSCVAYTLRTEGDCVGRVAVGLRNGIVFLLQVVRG